MSQQLGSQVLLIGGTGKVASRIAPLLSTNGNQILVASRSGSSPKLANAQGVKFDWDDSTTFANPFAGNWVSSIFLITPVSNHPLPQMKPFIDLAITKGVKRFVLLSSTAIATGEDVMMGKVAEYIISLNVEYTILRPSWFMENFSEVQHLPTIQGLDQIISATGEGKIPFVSADDIAAVAFRALADEVAHNTEHLIIGPDNLSYSDAAEIFTEELGRKITHVDITEAQFAEGIMAHGISEEYANALAALDTFIREGKEERVNSVVETVTGKKPVSLREFVKRNKAVWARV